MLNKLLLIMTAITLIASTAAWSVPLGGPGKVNQDRISGTLEVAGRFGIGTAEPGSKLTVAGTIETTLGGIKFSNGSLQTTAATATVHTIGESYGGGIVFYVYDSGKHGLIAATADQSAGVRWYGGTNTNTCARGDGVGAGWKNTSIIIANQGPVDGATFAARVCNEYSVTVGGVTYGDWYLPSKFELNLLYLQKTVVGGFADNNYWSSTEFSLNYAWKHNFNINDKFSDSKFNTYYVRAIRAF